jgi:hypothetical protein
MRALDFWRAVTVDEANFLEEFVELLERHRIAFCVVGGQAVNAYVEPLVSLDLDLAVAAGQLETVRALLPAAIRVEEFPHSLNLSRPGSDLRIQLRTDPRYMTFVDRAGVKDILGRALPVAALEDVLQGKVWAASDASRRGSKRQKDLADIARILESHPDLRSNVPPEILARLS